MLIESTPINCALNDASAFVNGTASVPQIPANKWAGIAPTTSSSLKLNNNLVPNTTINPPTAPVKIAGFGTYKVAKRKARVGRNPRTGEQIQIAASQKVKFLPAKALKEVFNR